MDVDSLLRLFFLPMCFKNIANYTMKRSEGDSDFANKHQGRTIINNKDKHLLLKYNKCLAHMWHADVPGSPRFYCPLPSYNSHPQRIGWLLPPTPHTSHPTGACESDCPVGGVGGGRRRSHRAVDGVGPEEEENRHRNTGDNGSLPRLF